MKPNTNTNTRLDYVDFLKKYSVDQMNYAIYLKHYHEEMAIYIGKQDVHMQEYLFTQRKLVDKFRSCLENIFTTKQTCSALVKPSDKYLKQNHQELNSFEKLLKNYSLEYHKNKENIKHNRNYIDNGPYLTDIGLIFPK